MTIPGRKWHLYTGNDIFILEIILLDWKGQVSYMKFHNQKWQFPTGDDS